MKNICFLSGYLISCVLPSKIWKHIQAVQRYVYTGYWSRYFESFGKNSVIFPTFKLLVGAKCISIGKSCIIDKGCQLTAWLYYGEQIFSPSIKIGDGSAIGESAHITAINGITIGNNVLCGKKILITDNSHGSTEIDMFDIEPRKRVLYSKGKVVIEDNVWIGEKASIMPGVHIGKGSIVAANSVVTHNVPAYTLVAGSPAKIIRKLRNNIQ